jgi:hypothetical protein
MVDLYDTEINRVIPWSLDDGAVRRFDMSFYINVMDRIVCDKRGSLEKGFDVTIAVALTPGESFT